MKSCFVTDPDGLPRNGNENTDTIRCVKVESKIKNTYFGGVDTDLRDLGVGRIMEED